MIAVKLAQTNVKAVLSKPNQNLIETLGTGKLVIMYTNGFWYLNLLKATYLEELNQ